MDYKNIEVTWRDFEQDLEDKVLLLFGASSCAEKFLGEYSKNEDNYYETVLYATL